MPSPEVHEFLRIRFTSNDPAALAHKAQLLMRAPDRTVELAHHLAAQKISALVLYGQDDDAWEISEQDRMAATLGAEIVVIDHAAHSPAVENVQATTVALVDFWNRFVQNPRMGV
jgi:hypothetical protein